jgi:hypothetical protein
MSLLGKLLAVLNILGAVALVGLAAMDYAKRKSWAFRVFEYELRVDGLPVTADKRNAKEQSVAELIGEQMQKELFAGGLGDPVTTQKAEVEKVHGALQGRVDAAGNDRRRQLYAFARILLPLADGFLEHERLRAYLTHLGDATTEKLKKDRLEPAFDLALDRTKGQFNEQLFRATLKDQGGDPLDAIATLCIKVVPEKPDQLQKLSFDKCWGDALTREAERLKARFDGLFAAAIRGQETFAGKTRPAYPEDSRRPTIARLLFGLCQARAEEELSSAGAAPDDKKKLDGLSPGAPEYRQRLVETAAYAKYFNRTQVVVGARAIASAIGDRGLQVRAMLNELVSEMTQERVAFVSAHQALVALARERADNLLAEQALRDRQQVQGNVQAALVKNRQREVSDHTEELKASRARSAEELRHLRHLSDELFKLRLKYRNSIDGIQQAEQEIRGLERKIRELEGNR